MQNPTPTEKVIAFTEAGDHKNALKIMKTFRNLTRDDMKVVGNGYEAIVHPDFYAQIYSAEWIAETIENAKAATAWYIAKVQASKEKK